MKLPKLLELIITLVIVFSVWSCASHRNYKVCKMPTTVPTAGTEWCEKHPDVDCCYRPDREK